jgi:multicomponent K+:H+ antiporter subunit A
LLPEGPMMLPAVIVQLLLPVSGMVAMFFLLRGHNEPGGGFVAGLVVATAVILQYLVGGTAWAESRTRIYPHYWIAMGLLCAVGAGVSAWAAGRPFLSALARDVTLPVIGAMHLSTVLLFDLGVFLLVVGAAVLILVALAHQSRRGHRRPGTAHIEAEGAISHAARTSATAAGTAVRDYPAAAQAPAPAAVVVHIPLAVVPPAVPGATVPAMARPDKDD